MTEEDKVKQLLYRFIDGGLLSKDVEKVLSCLSVRLLGIGVGEQGFVTSKDDVVKVLKEGIKPDLTTYHSVKYGRIETLFHEENFETICAEVSVISRSFY